MLKVKIYVALKDKDAIPNIASTICKHKEEIAACMNEECVQQVVASLLNGSRNIKYKVGSFSYEVDVSINGVGIEVKYNARPYDGVGQALAYIRLIKLRDAILLHVVNIDAEDYAEQLRELLKGLGINFIVIDKDGKCIIG